LKKTPELQKPGGAAAAPGQEKKITKEDALLKPSQIGITNKVIPAKALYKTIVSNPVLNSTDYGKAVISMANSIAKGQSVVLPPEYTTKENEQLRKAIVDYAGEYLGVLALLYGQSKFDGQAEFLQWLGGSLNDLQLFFPAEANSNLADSYANITNPKTSHTINISSKGTGGGAAPAISGLKIPDELRKNRKLANAIEFINLCQASDKARGPSTITSAFDAVDFIYQVNPKALPTPIHKFLPFSSKNPNLEPVVIDLIRKKDKTTPLPKKYSELFAGVSSKTASDAGKLVYNIKNIVADAVNNKNAIPEFRDTILQILEMNFIQQYADYNAGTITFETQWPAKLSGEINLTHKSSAVSPTDGGFSFKLGRPEMPAADVELGEPGDQDNPTDYETLDQVTQRRSSVKASGLRKPDDSKALGRKRR
jgi:hypothetical protein